MKKIYYSVRTGKIPVDNIVDLEAIKRLFSEKYVKLENDGYFQKYFGINCSDGYIPGELGEHIETMMFISTKKRNLYPIIQNLQNYSEDDFFDVIEFLHDHCSMGLNGTYDEYYYCRNHYEEFDDIQGQKQFRDTINPILIEYKDGFEVSKDGEILLVSQNGLSNLLEAEVPTNEKENISKRVDLAILKFRRYKSTLVDRKEAIRELADVLEFIRPSIKKHLAKKDENDIFNIANKFGIRHHNIDQQVEYDKAIWYSWIFYYYLATIHTVIRLANKT